MNLLRFHPKPIQGRNITLREAAEILGIHHSTLWKWTRPDSDKPGFPKIIRMPGSRQVLNGSELYAWLKSNGLAAPDDVRVEL